MVICDICDCIDSYTEFIYSALSEGNGALAFDPYLDVPTQKDTEKANLMLDKDQQNDLFGRRIKGEGYPESAKDKAAWALYHAARFKEHLNNRVMFKVCLDNCL